MLGRLFFLIPFLFLLACGGENRNSNEVSDQVEIDYDTRIKIKQYVAEGRKLYNVYCSNCHQMDGTGLAALFPPVKNSDYLMSDIGRSVCNVKNGIKGKIEVNGKIYDQNMPANTVLTNLDIAEILTYVLNEMNDTTALVSTKDVRNYLRECPPD